MRYILSMFLCIFLAWSVFSEARIFYVATDGSNGYPGTFDYPWRTISHAVSSSSDTFPANRPFKLYGFPGGTYVTLNQIQNNFPDQEIGSLWDNPDFVSYSDSNFHLSVGSPAIDAGTYVGFPYNGGAPDMGCFEYPGSGISSCEEPSLNFFDVYPNPFAKLMNISFSVGRSAKSVELRIYDISGRLVRSFNHLTIQPFNQNIWCGDDDFGRKVSAGIYCVVLTLNSVEKTADKHITKKIIKLN